MWHWKIITPIHEQNSAISIVGATRRISVLYVHFTFSCLRHMHLHTLNARNAYGVSKVDCAPLLPSYSGQLDDTLIVAE